MDYPIDKQSRRVKLSPEIATVLREHIQTNHLGRDDLLFALPTPEPNTTESGGTPPPELSDLGWTEPNKDARTYQHGTVTAYNLSGCRCQHCRDACARYRAQRRADGKDDPRMGRRINTHGHIPRRWFAQHIWTHSNAPETAHRGRCCTPFAFRHRRRSGRTRGGPIDRVRRRRRRSGRGHTPARLVIIVLSASE